MNTLPKVKGPFYSLDLSNATDSFSMKFQREVLGMLISEEYSDAWSDIMIGYPFRNITPGGPDVYYRQGQPMGAYSS